MSLVEILGTTVPDRVDLGSRNGRCGKLGCRCGEMGFRPLRLEGLILDDMQGKAGGRGLEHGYSSASGQKTDRTPLDLGNGIYI